MIYIFRFLVIFCVLNLINMVTYNGGAGMEPVWVVMMIGFLALSFKKVYKYFFSKKWFKAMFYSILIIFIIVESMMLTNGYKTTIEDKSDYIIVLGARVKGETMSLALRYRVDKAYEYLEKNKETKAILSGGKGNGENISEAEAMRRYLTGKGISEDRLLLEDKSTNTDENIYNSFIIIDEIKSDAKIIVITSRFHVLRAKMIAKDNGKAVEGIGVKTMQYLIPNYYLREFFAVIKEFII